MRLRNLWQDDEAVSPVIGVILMVAITVILAAVIASFVLGLGPSEPAPTTNFEFDWDSSGSQLTVTVEGGDKVNSDRLTLVTSSNEQTWSDAGSGSTELTAGSSVTIGGGTFTLNSGNEVRVTWEPEGGGSSQTLTTFEIP